jgi:uncharacterized protein (UPF0212 family)
MTRGSVFKRRLGANIVPTGNAVPRQLWDYVDIEIINRKCPEGSF